METIHFYSVQGDYGALSNFAPYPIVMKGRRWPTSEHYFQAQKFVGTPREDEVRRASTPAEAARMGRDRKHRPRRDWDSARDGVMHAAVVAKFTQHAELRSMLLATGDARLVEHTDSDDYWGDGGDGSGRNRLGEILMQVRDALR
ncbi:MAG: NADAR family protein [Deltaproteobacteria bacterium]|nr:NADAR family protein [Deltaproteobacteria bacterium]MBK8696392.1 NADAR family protein [Deltaproteobacteria bacterium]MBP6832057.1 NADAR family protein [Deltaproteobacteria bacterium]